MRCVLVVVAALALAPAAHAAPPAASVQVSAASGGAPLAVTFTASGDAVAWRWDFGDGTSAEGPVASHSYGAGRWTATLTATSATGESTVVRTPGVAYALTLAAPARGTWDEPVRLSGRLTPAERGTVSLYRGTDRISTAPIRNGAWRVVTRLRGRGPYVVRYGSVNSAPKRIAVAPVLDARVEGAPVVGGTLTVSARLRPVAAGRLQARITSGGKTRVHRARGGVLRVRLPSERPADFRVTVASTANDGYFQARRTLRATVVHPTLAVGSRGASVRVLEQRLRDLRFVLKTVDGLYANDTREAVLAFQKTLGLPRTGRVDAAVWRRLLAAGVPRARYAGGPHIEVDKSRQILMEVVGGEVVNVLHVSTGATGNTPLGRWNVYRKVPGWDWVLWYPMYFLRGFAIHGYPSVPAYPASHGCVRVPMWFAPVLYRKYGHGATIYVYA